MFKLLRYYSAASLVAVLAAAVLLIWFYRQVAIQGIVQLAERSNMHLAKIAMDPIKPVLLEFLGTAADLHPGNASPPPLPSELARSIKTLMQDKFIVKIKIYNRQGVVAFSTKPAEIGFDRSDNQGVIAAIAGGVGNALVYRDTFNSFDGVTEKDNLMQTYLPVRAGPAEPILGVFELYADVNDLVHQTERTEFIIMAGAILILSALYAVLIVIVRRANDTIELQQRTIRERTETLELLSAHMLKSEESQKKRIAFELHEGLAQTLSAAKLLVESGRDRRVCNAAAAAKCVRSIIPVLQDAIQEVRTIATDLRPASLDDLGLLPTINWFCREFEQRHPGIRIERQIPLREHDIPTPLKVILYRIIASVLDDMTQHTNAGRIHLALGLNDNALILLIDDTAAEALDETAPPPTHIKPQLRAEFARMEELATLSGGVFSAKRHLNGGTTLRAAWHV
ncbi:sensor histidine kinase [Rhodoferax ferrireducens]|uniref:sensor histidine kinase n=1 Tax=Rhodoferax ferrireducens TaxID=192843 RepID=UPI000E0D5780|nr:histidine kinase [Rhodoferax ferrireducens]